MFSALKETILKYIGVIDLPEGSFMTIPGLISSISQTLKTPFIKVPPATPPCKFSDSSPGWLISKDLTTINLGGDNKSLLGIGNLQIWYIIESILYFNCADIGIIGDLAAFVP